MRTTTKIYVPIWRLKLKEEQAIWDRLERDIHKGVYSVSNCKWRMNDER